MEDLTRYRNEIDNIDKELIQLFEKRMNTVLEIARHKMKNNTTIPVSYTHLTLPTICSV